MKVSKRNYIRFTRSSIIVYRTAAKMLGLTEGDVIFNANLHDINGAGNLYTANKTGFIGILQLFKEM